MTTQTEALKLALEALETSARNWPSDSIIEAITAIKEALAQPEQEPVAKLKLMMEESAFEGRIELSDALLNIEQFYTTPPQRKPLTDEEIGAILEGVNAYGTRLYTFARAIEAAHGIKEKNT